MTAQTELTPAQQQAEVLAALAEHLRAYPDLEPVYVTPHASLQIPSRRSAAGFVAWFASLGVRELRVRLEVEHGYAAVHALQVGLGGHRVEMWGGLEGLHRWLVQAGYGEGLRLTVAELEHFAARGALPEAGDPR
jgi:hypothetical protein